MDCRVFRGLAGIARCASDESSRTALPNHELQPEVQVANVGLFTVLSKRPVLDTHRPMTRKNLPGGATAAVDPADTARTGWSMSVMNRIEKGTGHY